MPERLPSLDGGAGGMARVGAQVGDAARDRHGRPFQRFAFGHRGGRSAGGGDAPDVAAVDIVLVGRVDDLLAVLGVRDVLDFKVAGRKGRRRRRLRAGRSRGAPSPPSPRGRRCDCRRPRQAGLGDHRVEDAAVTGIGLPDLAAGAIGDIGDADGPRIARCRVRRGPSATVTAANMRVKASCLLSGDQPGCASRSVLGSR